VLELVHMDLVGPSRYASLSGKYYALVIVDDFSRFTWVRFIVHKNDAFNEFAKWCRLVQNEKNLNIIAIRTDHGGEFECDAFEKLCDKYGVAHNFSSP
ncbi:transposase family protein, partial [Vibrio vulnificus]|nr:transposase family protein [Vibrio vulnificus]